MVSNELSISLIGNDNNLRRELVEIIGEVDLLELSDGESSETSGQLIDVALVDCRNRLLKVSDNPILISNSNTIFIAIIHEMRLKRNFVFGSGYKDFIVWPVIEPEVRRRIEQCKLGTEVFKSEYRHSTDPLVEKACLAMGKDLAGNFSILSLCELLATNHNTLNKRFKIELGLTPISWLRKARMSKAAKLLRQSNKAVEDVAARVGYENPESFSTIFKREIGLSPNNYRKRMNEKQ
ncbi:MAG: AraC family transcriptional regulator [Pseudomonadota bacterium]